MKSLTQIIEYKNCDVQTLPKGDLWLRVAGGYTADDVHLICEHYDIHQLLIEDILNYNHPPKYEKHEHYAVYIMKLFDNTSGEVTLRQFSMIKGENFVITFEESSVPYIESYFKKVSNLKDNPVPRLVTYKILDMIVDHYLDLANNYQDRLDSVIDDLIDSNSYNLSELFDIKREIHLFRRTVRPVLNIVDNIYRVSTDSYPKNMLVYIKDLFDHINRVTGIADNMWEEAINIQNEILTKLQYKLSSTMNVMTAVSMIFLPLMFITGIYGMNFVNMPELQYEYGYFIVLGIMLLISTGLLIFFIRRKLM